MRTRGLSKPLAKLFLTGISFSLMVSACGKPAGIDSSTHPLMPRYPDEIEATTLFGPLVVRPGFQSYRAGDHDPWTAWYYPLNDTYFFKSLGSGANRFTAPFEKYDLYARSYASAGLRVPDSHAQQTEKETFESNHFDQNAGWMGFCHATAAAAIAEKMPDHSSPPSCALRFSIADLRALLIRTYEEVDGSRNFGSNFKSDRTERDYISYGDIFPDQLLRLVQVYLGDKKRSFYIDTSLSEEIWNEAIIAAKVTLSADPADSQLLHGTMTLQTAKSTTVPFNWQYKPGDPDYYDWLDSNETRPVTRDYTFDLIGAYAPGGDFHVTAGTWTGNSRLSHPDFATVLPDQIGAHRSTNPDLKTEIVEEILEKTRNGQCP